MFTQDNLPTLLISLGFEKSGNIYRKQLQSAWIEVDFSNKKIHYPAGLKVNEQQTCNFEANENFVVLECVHRLLEKGYQPEHIELEPKWKLGRGASGGRADILIRDNESHPLLLIECKTPGTELRRAWNKTLQDGDQLFSYAQQISETQFLCLYTSEFDHGTVRYTSHIIAHRDNEKYLADNPQLKGFQTASDVKERFQVWRDTYKQDYTTKGIFEDNIQPYFIGKDKYTLEDLQAISASDQQKKYHEFATILRQHNVSGRENAFDKLINLFLCKLVDEIENPNDLKFYWKGVAYDTHFGLMDRLQQLYQAGMAQFLGEEITYINQENVNNALRFIRQNPDATQRAVWNLFIQQKFFTNNDFSFINVHNEKLFYQNADVLLKVLQMWQDIRLTSTDGHNQFLGDLFEGFLDQGVKQSEGQYFTPMPICRFILMSLPLQSMVAQHEIPQGIDYACGAGHFLTELALQLQPLVATHQPGLDMAAVHARLYGIEKEYRLSKVAKVSAFMYGQQNINICYGDALVKHHDAFPAIADDTFDLLVANPPYSVRGFLATLPEAERQAYALSSSITDLDTANSIEAFFIERAKQLLRGGGVAAIILPSSILSNSSSVYVRAREILLQYFDLMAIAEFGSGTFGKTGTNTVTLFLRRKKTAPDTAEHYRERVNDWFSPSTTETDHAQAVYQDMHLLVQYASHIQVPLPDYQTLLAGDASGSWQQHPHFGPYLNKFNDSTEVKNLYKAKWFKALDEAAQNAEIDRRYLAYVQGIERDKLHYFVLAASQPNRVLIVRSPTETKAIKQFLGYDWSAAKGDEGIKLTKDVQGRHLTPLYDESDRNNPEKINSLIAANFDGTLLHIPENLQVFAHTTALPDMLDFSRTTFEKQINLSAKKQTPITSKWPLATLGNLAEIKKGTPITQKTAIPGPYKVVAGGTTHAYMHNTFNREANIITVSASGAAGFVAFWREPIFASDCITVRGTDDEQTKYLYHVLKSRQQEIQAMASGAAQPHVYSKDLQGIQIAKPDSATLKMIVLDCEAIEHEVNASQTRIQQTLAQLESEIASIYASSSPHVEINEIATSIQYGISEKMNESGMGYKIFRMNEIVQGRMVDNGQMKYADISAEEFSKYRLNKGDLLFIRSNGSLEHIGKTGTFDLDGDYCYASYLVRIVPDRSKILPGYLRYIMNSAVFRKGMVSLAVKSGGTNNINATKMRNIKVPLPPLTEQQQLVATVEKLEQQIATAQSIIDSAPARKRAILQQYL